MTYNVNYKWDMIPNFTPEEFFSPDTNEEKMDWNLILRLQSARIIANIPFIINSGYRTEAHNKKVGGVKNSFHLKGQACDIKTTSETKYEIIFALKEAGFQTILVYENFVHVDIRENGLGIREIS